jgi:ribosome recycling factor
MAYNFTEFKQRLKEAEEWMMKEFSSLRTGRASITLLDGIMVESYGAMMPISNVANLNVEDARSIRISPWDMSQIAAIEKGIQNSSLGISPVVDDKGLRIVFPDLTSERRVTILKMAKEKLEDAKVRVRQDREKVLKDIQSKEKENEFGKDESMRYHAEVDKLIKEQNAKFDELFEKKEKEIQS